MMAPQPMFQQPQVSFWQFPAQTTALLPYA